MTSAYKFKIDAMSNGPYAIAHNTEFGTVFIENACPGDLVQAEIYDQRKDFAFANLETVLESSSLRMAEPPCKIHKICGSCQWQHLDYIEQLKFKKENLIDLMSKIEFTGEVPDLIGMDSPWNYRNKIIYPVNVVKETGRVLAGYFKRNSNELINIKHCPIQYSIFDEIMDSLKETMSTRGYHPKLVRHIMMRSNLTNSEILVCVIVRSKILNKEFKNKLKADLRKLQEKFKQIKTTVLNYNDLSTNVILGNESELITGEGFITESFGDIKLQISTTSFFQVNTLQFLKIIDLIKTFINPKSKVLDLYCGIGTISLSLAKAFPELDITGIEVVASAIANAQANAQLNDIKSAKFIEGKVEDKLTAEPGYDTVIINPPRKGCTNQVLDTIAAAQSPQLIYVSCNPATLTRDIKYLEQFGYKLKFIQSVDMFPHSFHFETVAILELEHPDVTPYRSTSPDNC